MVYHATTDFKRKSEDLFNFLSEPKDYSFKCRKLNYQEYELGVNILKREGSEHNIYIIISGRVKVGFYSESGVEIITDIISKHDVFGDMSLFKFDNSKYFAITLEANTKIGYRSTNEVLMMLSENMDLANIVYSNFTKRNEKLEKRICNCTQSLTKPKVIYLLLELSEEYGLDQSTNILIPGHYSHKNISKFIGTSRQKVTVAMSELRDKSIIDYSREQLLIYNKSELLNELKLSLSKNSVHS
ncbi:MAG: Crp/Fnr family transcriptional regulator [Cyclobacteriaceae bacterium]